MVSSKNIQRVLLLFFFISATSFYAQETISSKNTEAILYLGKGEKQPLIVGLGGSEGGNAWTSDYWKKARDQFIEKGYAFLAIGYFNAPGTPKLLEKIAIEDVHNAIVKATQNKQVDGERIAIVGGSRGGDLALLIASYYDDIDCVVGLVASHAVFPGNTNHFTTTTWTQNGVELPFIPVNEASVPFIMKRDLRGAFTAMLQDTVAEQKALIKVENIKAPILLISATEDEIAPTTPMGNKIMNRLKQHKFQYYTEHITIVGSHGAPLKHFELVFNFLKHKFPMEK
ncbi:alpha/beta hydrolase fold domain-containing protein [Kordia sp. YSTF-M3]|uniref:Alpha/beta hydrolase fold domain-containing protein n=1 Tax=Kordia aestuariivivens TaxID=2759037 RepID=A0ABR7QAD7_9FLAO|nr:acyl-CoA thioester hydrolase/BAAT C-terminal domain-containing protein [Kordia aestuariivivens]MBC8755363.1 alpha/beta hydrolase fold domain-containing protein [Kordia aestuariivivens]